MANGPHQIPISEAAALTYRWRHNCPPGSLNGGRFDRIAFDNILAQPGCAGIRVYIGLHDANDPGQPGGQSLWTFVLVGTDAAGNDIVTVTRPGLADADGDTEQEPVLCPPNCGDDSPLNSPP